jgi:hypothetical protein
MAFAAVPGRGKMFFDRPPGAPPCLFYAKAGKFVIAGMYETRDSGTIAA